MAVGIKISGGGSNGSTPTSAGGTKSSWVQGLNNYLGSTPTPIFKTNLQYFNNPNPSTAQKRNEAMAEADPSSAQSQATLKDPSVIAHNRISTARDRVNLVNAKRRLAVEKNIGATTRLKTQRTVNTGYVARARSHSEIIANKEVDRQSRLGYITNSASARTSAAVDAFHSRRSFSMQAHGAGYDSSFMSGGLVSNFSSALKHGDVGGVKSMTRSLHKLAQDGTKELGYLKSLANDGPLDSSKTARMNVLESRQAKLSGYINTAHAVGGRGASGARGGGIHRRLMSSALHKGAGALGLGGLMEGLGVGDAMLGASGVGIPLAAAGAAGIAALAEPVIRAKFYGAVASGAKPYNDVLRSTAKLSRGYNNGYGAYSMMKAFNMRSGESQKWMTNAGLSGPSQVLDLIHAYGSPIRNAAGMKSLIGTETAMNNSGGFAGMNKVSMMGALGQGRNLGLTTLSGLGNYSKKEGSVLTLAVKDGLNRAHVLTNMESSLRLVAQSATSSVSVSGLMKLNKDMIASGTAYGRSGAAAQSYLQTTMSAANNDQNSPSRIALLLANVFGGGAAFKNQAALKNALVNVVGPKDYAAMIKSGVARKDLKQAVEFKNMPLLAINQVLAAAIGDPGALRKINDAAVVSNVLHGPLRVAYIRAINLNSNDPRAINLENTHNRGKQNLRRHNNASVAEGNARMRKLNTYLKSKGLNLKERALVIGQMMVETGNGRNMTEKDTRGIYGSYEGRGPFQLTGIDNYKYYGKLIGMHNKLAKDPQLAANSKIGEKLTLAYAETNGIVADSKNGTAGIVAFSRAINGPKATQATIDARIAATHKAMVFIENAKKNPQLSTLNGSTSTPTLAQREHAKTIATKVNAARTTAANATMANMQVSRMVVTTITGITNSKAVNNTTADFAKGVDSFVKGVEDFVSNLRTSHGEMVDVKKLDKLIYGSLLHEFHKVDKNL